MKRGCLMFAISIALVMASFTTASAAGPTMQDFSKGVADAINVIREALSPFFEVIIGEASSGEFFFAKCLVLILLFMIVFAIAEKIPGLGENRWIRFIIAAVFSIFTVRYIPDNQFMYGILIPYQAAGTALIVFLPYLIYLFFLHESVPSKSLRRAGWIAFGLIYLGLWLFKRIELDDTSNFIHIAGLVLIGGAYIADEKIHQIFEKMRWSKAVESIENKARSDLLKEYREYLDRYNKTQDPYAKKVLKNLAKRMRNEGLGDYI